MTLKQVRQYLLSTYATASIHSLIHVLIFSIVNSIVNSLNYLKDSLIEPFNSRLSKSLRKINKSFIYGLKLVFGQNFRGTISFT